ncbi:MAG: SDR family oxidoreductase [Betaproteobacteria bacterium]|nr:SDR family oxidoreductase [Betaproteobacteria bacterium]
MAAYPELQGKVAIITGAGRRGGLGAAIAMRLAAEGAHAVVADLGAAAGPHLPASAIGASSEMQAVVAEINAAGGSALALPCNMLDGAAVEQLVDSTVARLGCVDILVNNAGIGYLMKPIVDMSLEEWDTVLGVNLRGVFAATQAVAKRFAAQAAAGRHGGRIINIASQAAKSGFPHAASYCASKHGLVGLTRVAAIELAPLGVTVNAVCPNHVTTGLGAWQNEYFAKLLGKSVEQYLADMRARIPLGRPGLPGDTAAAVAFLCSEQAQYITGESMNVSGGEEMH